MNTLDFELVAPSPSDVAIARESASRLPRELAGTDGPVKLLIGERDGANMPVAIPAPAFRLLVRILNEMANGHGVHLVPHHAELTTGEAAELLNVSRPYVVRLLDEGRIPSHRAGTHRRVLFTDVMKYRNEHRRARGASLDKLSALDQELGLT